MHPIVFIAVWMIGMAIGSALFLAGTTIGQPFFPCFRRSSGLRIPLPFGRQLEFWYSPRGESIPMHHHERCHGRLIFLAGRMRWQGGSRSVEFRGRDIFRSLCVKAGEAHGAVVTGRFGLFVNFETWTHNRTSAAHDFVAH